MHQYYILLFAQTADELIESAQFHQRMGLLLGQLAFMIFAGMFLFGSYKTVRNGFTITKEKKLTGVYAKIIAGLFAMVGIGIALFALLYLPYISY